MNNLFSLRKSRAAIAMLLLALVVLSFAVRAVVPAGFMPAQNGTYELVVCTGMGEKTILMNQDGTPAEKSGHEEKSDLCAYQILTSQQNLTTPVFTIVPFTISELRFPVLPGETSVSSYKISAHSARGPPSFLI